MSARGMKLTISALHFELSEKIEEYARLKVTRLSKYYPNIEDVKVRLIGKKSHRGQDQDYYCEITCHLAGKVIELTDAERAMDKAIDKAVDRMKIKLVRTKEKQIAKTHRRGLVYKFLRRFSN